MSTEPSAPARGRRPRALVLAEHEEVPVKLTSREEVLVEQALRRGEHLPEQVNANVMAYRRCLLEEVVGRDPSVALAASKRSAPFLAAAST